MPNPALRGPAWLGGGGGLGAQAVQTQSGNKVRGAQGWCGGRERDLEGGLQDARGRGEAAPGVGGKGGRTWGAAQAKLRGPTWEPNAPSPGAPKRRLLWRGSWAKWAGPAGGRGGGPRGAPARPGPRRTGSGSAPLICPPATRPRDNAARSRSHVSQNRAGLAASDNSTAPHPPSA